MTHVPVGVAGEQVFRRHPVRAAVNSLILSVVLAGLVLFLLPRLLPTSMNIPTRGIVVLFVIIALVGAVWAWAFWFNSIRVVLRPDAVEVGRRGSTTIFPRASTVFRSHITEHRTNGIRSGTTRALIAYADGRETRIDLPGFTRATFNELMAALNPVARPLADTPVEAARARAQLASTFTVDASGERRLGNVFLVIGIVCVLLALGVVAFAFTPGFLDGELSGLVLIVPFAGLAGFGLLLGAGQRLRIARRTPAQLTVGHHGIRIGDVDHAYDSLSRIWLTPPSYPIARMKIERAAGRAATYVLSSSRIRITPEYAEFVLALSAETAQRPGLVSLDLE